MGQVFTTEEFQKLNPKNLIRWEDLVNAEYQQNINWSVSEAMNPLNGLSSQSRLFYPRSFSVSSSLNSLNTPWFIDYGHLMFWFFFISTFIIVMWLVTLHSLASKHIETRFPKRETRGFSRAQTGDVMTAVLPLTWSITMLMHASTHSINFDENTAATVFSFTVVAYQWGWNYYFPRDIVDKLARGPRLVGRGGIDLNQNNTDYSLLLEKARYEYMARIAARGNFSDKNGKEVMSGLLSLYSRAGTPSQTMSLQSEMQLLTSLCVLNSCWNAAKMQNLWRSSRPNTRLVEKNPSSLNLSSSATAWMLAGFGEARFSSLKKNPKLLKPASWYMRPAYPYTASLASKALDMSSHKGIHKSLNKVIKFKNQPARYLANTTRIPSSLFLIGNRLGLIHKHLSSTRELPRHLTSRTQVANKIRSFIQKDKAFAALNNMSPSWAKTQHVSTITKENILPNLWLLKGVKSLFPLGLNDKITNPTRRPQLLDYLGSKKNTSFNKGLGYNHFNFAQKNLFSGAPYTLSYASSNLATLEDLGLTNSATIKEFSRKLNSQITTASVFALHGYLTLPSRSLSKNFGLNLFADSYSRFFSHYLTAAQYNYVSNHTTLPYSSNNPQNWFLSNQALSQEAQTSKNLWMLSVLPQFSNSSNLVTTFTWAKNMPAVTLNQKGFEPKLVQKLNWYNNTSVYSSPTEGTALVKNKLLFNASVSSLNKLNTFKIRTSRLSSLITFPQRLQPLILQKQFVTGGLNFSLNHQKSIIKIPLTIKFVPTALTSTANTLVNFTISTLRSPRAKTSTVVWVKPLWSNSTKFATQYKPRDLIAVHTQLRKPAISSWLEAAASQKPVRSTMDKTGDPTNFSGKAEVLTGQPFFTNKLMSAWYFSWTNSTLNFAFPTPKTYRGGLAKKPLTSFWYGSSTNALSSLFFLEDKLKSKLDKEANLTQLSSFRYSKIKTLPAPLSYPVLDSEWAYATRTPVVLTPEPNEDVDQNFMHQKWTIDINTTRRSDHTSKFKVTWGPWSSLKKNTLQLKSTLTDANALAGVIGSSSMQNLTAEASQNIALFNEAVLPFKTSTGLTRLNPIANSGKVKTISRIRGKLLNPILPVDIRLKTALTRTQKLDKVSRSSGLYRNFCVNKTPWLALWDFKQKVSDSSWTGQRLNSAFASSYWTDKALLALSNQNLQKTKIQNLGWYGARPVSALGSAHPLLYDLNGIGNYLGFPNYSTSKETWFKSSAYDAVTKHATQLVDAVENAVDAHLVSRANYSLALDEIGSIRRLRVTKGVYLPSDTPMHVICGSKDVIHSWALPGLNVKIDCIPGFNSHRRLLLRWRGAYWGQCMEVCGRYHHWMPILIHVVHKDIFLSWCLTYLRLVDAKALELSRNLALITSVDLLTLDNALACLLTPRNIDPQAHRINAYLVSSDLDD